MVMEPYYIFNRMHAKIDSSLFELMKIIHLEASRARELDGHRL